MPRISTAAGTPTSTVAPCYFSCKDIDACMDFEIDTLSHKVGYVEIKTLFDTLVKEYKPDE